MSGRAVTVHALQTGTVTIKGCHHTCCLPEWTPLAARFTSILADPRWAEPMPVWTYAIDLGGRVVVVDAGAGSDYDDPSTWAPDQAARRLLHRFIRLDVSEDETLPARLGQVGIAVDDVSDVVLTHQHIDHTAAVPSFPDAHIWTTRAEDRARAVTGACQWRWRNDETRIRHVDTEGRPGDLGPTVELEQDGSLRLVHTPGHTPGSVSVMLLADQGEVWFTGDTSFTADGMNPRAPTAGVHTSMREVRRLQARLTDRWLLLPAHDPDVPDRLQTATANLR